MVRPRIPLRTAAGAILAAGLLAQPALAQNVTLTGKEGSMNITGTLLSAEGGKFQVRTLIGDISVDQALVTCTGEGCPQVREIDYDLNLAGPGDIAEVLIPILTDGFAHSLDAEANVLDQYGNPVEQDTDQIAYPGGKIGLQLADFNGDVIANFGIQETIGGEIFDLLAEREASIILTEKLVTDADRQRIARSGGGDLATYEQERVIAVDGLAVIVNPDSTVPSVRIQDLAAIFGGAITNWRDIGGPNAPINLYTFDEGTDGYRDVDELLVTAYGYRLTDEANIVRSNREMTAAVTADPFGIGVVGYSSIRGTRAIPLINECGMESAPTPFAIKTEEYPLQRRILAYNTNDVDDLGRQFLQHLEGSDMDGLVAKAGFIDLSVVAEDQSDVSRRARNIRAQLDERVSSQFIDGVENDMLNSRRLSTTFRFAPASAELDNKAQRDLARVVDYIAETQPERVLIVGFADSFGPFESNRTLSLQRAETLAQQLRFTARDGQLRGVDLQVRGFSELSPVACNENFAGRAINRRVEVWVR